jgi:hypothetical protein
MKRSRLLMLLIALAAPCAIAVADETPAAPPAKPAPPKPAEVRAACEADVQKLCAGIQPGAGRVMACLKRHKADVSEGCKQAVAKARQGAS